MIIGIDASRAFGKDKTGTENYSYEVLRELVQLKESKKHQFRLYLRGVGSELKKEFEWLDKENIKLVKIGWKRLWTQGGLASECLLRPPDVLWVPAHTLPVIRRRNLKTVVTIHGLEYEYLPEYYKFPQKLWLNKSTEYAVKEADRLIAVSKWTKRQLVERLGADEGKIEVIHEGISPKFFHQGSSFQRQERFFSGEYMRQIRHKYSLPRKYVLFVGTIQPRKNLVRLIEAFSMMLTKALDVDLVLAGKEGWMTEKIMEAPGRYGVEDRVKFIGRVAEADLAAVYHGASLFVWPSLMEGFGLPVLEAMTMGLPVIASNKGALPEVVGKAGLLVDPEKVSEIAGAMELVLGSLELRNGLIEKGYKQIKKFSYKKTAKESLKILEFDFKAKK